MVSSVIKKQSFDYEKIAMAYHEASHTVVGLYNYFRIDSVHIISDRFEHGNTDFTMYADSIDDSELKKMFFFFEIQTYYAGLVGEKIYYKDITGSDKFPIHLREGSAEDIKIAAKIIRKNNLSTSGKKTYVLKKQIQYDVECILEEYWDDVKLIAHLLYQKKRLSFADLKHILIKRSDNKDFWKQRFKIIILINRDEKRPEENEVKDILLQDTIISI